MNLIDRAIGSLESIDRKATLRLNIMRMIASGFVWFILVSIQEGSPMIGFIFVMPFSVACCVVLGLIARGLALVRVPFAGLFEAMMRIIVMAGDPLLRLVLQLWGEKFGMPYVIPWLSFSLILLTDRDEGVSTPEQRLKAALASVQSRKIN